MRKQPVLGMAAAAILVLTAACDDSSTAPTVDLDSGETDFIAVQADAILASILTDYTNSFGDEVVGVAEGVALNGSAEPIVTTFDFVRTRPCSAGGQVVATGSGTHSFDREAQTRETDASGSKSIEACSRVRGDLTFTLSGSGIFDFHRLKVGGSFSGLQTTNHSGSFTATVSDGRVEDCTYELHRVLDPDAGTITVTGELCGNEVDKVMEWNG